MTTAHARKDQAADLERQATILVNAIEDLAGAHEFYQVTAIVREAARQLTGADGVTFVLRAGERCNYVDESAISPPWKGQSFPVDYCISGWAMLNHQVAVIPDVYEDARIPHEPYRSTFVKSLLMVPVRPQDPLAAIGAYWSQHYMANATELTLLQSLARASDWQITRAGRAVAPSPDGSALAMTAHAKAIVTDVHDIDPAPRRIMARGLAFAPKLPH